MPGSGTRELHTRVELEPGVAYLPDASREALIESVARAGLGLGDALFFEAMEELNDQQRVAVNLIDRALPLRT